MTALPLLVGVTAAAQASATSARPPVAPNRSGLSSRSRRKRGAA